jgi:O-antigen ligase
VTGTAASDSRASAAWALAALVAAGAWTAFDQAYDAGVLKTAVCALVAGVVVLPALAWRGREALAGWFMGTGGRLLLLSAAFGLPMTFAALDHATVTDRLLLLGLANVAAVAGWATASARPSWLGWSVIVAAAVSAAVCLAQALGWETSLTESPDEVVGLAGNTTRAGVLCALGLVAVAGRILGASGDDPRPGAAPDDRSDSSLDERGVTTKTDAAGEGSPPVGRTGDLLATALGVVLAAALVLTRARAARWVALLVMALLVILAVRRHGPALRMRCSRLALVIGAGVAIAGMLGGTDALLGHKLDTQAPIFSGRDPTTGVRLSLAMGALEMIGDRPGLGVGLGRYRQHAGAYRDPDEAALPGLAGGVTEAEHPHNELLLSFVESGVVGGALLVLLLLVGARRAFSRARSGHGHACLVDLGLLATGMILGLAQDAWTDPGTAMIFYAALGASFGATTPADPQEQDPMAQPAIGSPLLAVVALLLGLGLALGGWPRLDAHLSLRTVYLRVAPEGKISPETFGVLERAADIAPTDLAVQRFLVSLGEQYIPIIVNDDGRDAVRASVEQSKARLAALAPVPRAGDEAAADEDGD